MIDARSEGRLMGADFPYVNSVMPDGQYCFLATDSQRSAAAAVLYAVLYYHRSHITIIIVMCVCTG